MTNKNYYTPQQDGVAGLEDFGDVTHGTNYEQCRPVDYSGVRAVGPTYEPALVAEYLRNNPKSRPNTKLIKVYCGPAPLDTSKPDPCTSIERRQGWRWEEVSTIAPIGQPAAIAKNALHFEHDFDKNPVLGNAGTDVISGTNELGSNSTNVTSRKVVIRDPENDAA